MSTLHCSWRRLTIYYHYILFLFLVFLGLHPWLMDVLRLGIESKLQLLAYITAMTMWDLSCICNVYHSSGQHWILKTEQGQGLNLSPHG